MLALLDASDGPAAQRIAQRVRFASDLETLWYLRQDVLLAVSAVDGEVVAQQHLNRINHLFKHGLPQTMGPRVHHRFTA